MTENNITDQLQKINDAQGIDKLFAVAGFLQDQNRLPPKIGRALGNVQLVDAALAVFGNTSLQDMSDKYFKSEQGRAEMKDLANAKLDGARKGLFTLLETAAEMVPALKQVMDTIGLGNLGKAISDFGSGASPEGAGVGTRKERDGRY